MELNQNTHIVLTKPPKQYYWKPGRKDYLVRLSPDAYAAVLSLQAKTGLTLLAIASSLITQAASMCGIEEAPQDLRWE